jgi:hypothetical protein
LFLLACSLVALPGIAWAQTIPLASAAVSDTTVRHSVRLLDGTTLVGRIVDIGADSVRVQIDGGTVVVARKAVESVQQFPISHLRNGSYWFENPHGTRLLFSSTAFPLEKGSGYYANTWIFLHTFAGGLTDRFTLGGGVLWFPGLSIDETFLYLLPKYTVVDGEKGKLAIGALAGWLPYVIGSRALRQLAAWDRAWAADHHPRAQQAEAPVEPLPELRWARPAAARDRTG